MTSWAILIATAVAALCLDQAAKRLATPRRAGRMLGTRAGISDGVLWVLWACLVAAATAAAALVPLDPAVLLGLGACLGGASSNLLDSLGRGSIVDHIHVARWSFNLADAALVLGACASVGGIVLRSVA